MSGPVAYKWCDRCEMQVPNLPLHNEARHAPKRSKKAAKETAPPAWTGGGSTLPAAPCAPGTTTPPPRGAQEGGNSTTGTTPPASPSDSRGGGLHAASSPLRADEGVESGTSLAQIDPDELTDLAVERICDALSKCVDVDELRNVVDVAVAMKGYHRKRRASLEMQNHAAAIRLHAERRLGELLRDTLKIRRGPKGAAPAPIENPALADLKITKKESAMWQRVAAVSKDDFERRIADAKANHVELTTTRVLGLSTHPAAKADEAAAKDSAPAAPAPREEPKPAAPAQRVDLPEDAEDAAALVISDRGPLWAEDLIAALRRKLAPEAA